MLNNLRRFEDYEMPWEVLEGFWKILGNFLRI